MTPATENGREPEGTATAPATTGGAIPARDIFNVISAVTIRQLSRFARFLDGSATDVTLAQYREAPVGVDASDPEAELCVECLSYPATYRSRCFTCNARRTIAERRGIA